MSLVGFDVPACRRGNLPTPRTLDVTLAQKVYGLFLRGNYETAVFQAFKEIEVLARKACTLPNSVVGTDLMRQAFDPKNGRLSAAVWLPTRSYQYEFVGFRRTTPTSA